MCLPKYTEGVIMKRNNFLDILKGISVIFVITTHYTWSRAQRQDLLFFFWIGMAVPIFMIITGYVYTKSYQKNEMNTLGKAYSLANILSRLLRFVIPFGMIYVIEISLRYFLEHRLNIRKIPLDMLLGGKYYGSYYIPMMFQFVFIFPISYFIIKKKGFKGVIICGIINTVYELMTNFEWFPKSTYRVLVFRFILVIAYGCYVAFYEKAKMKKSWAVVSLFIGTAYLIILTYKLFKVGFFPYWKHVNMLACLYIMPIMGVLIRKGRGKCAPLELIGKASFNIFLVQKLYYHFFAKDYIYTIVDGFYLRLIANIVICCIVGVIFYYIESPITTKLVKVCRKTFSKENA